VGIEIAVRAFPHAPGKMQIETEGRKLAHLNWLINEKKALSALPFETAFSVVCHFDRREKSFGPDLTRFLPSVEMTKNGDMPTETVSTINADIAKKKARDAKTPRAQEFYPVLGGTVDLFSVSLEETADSFRAL
jgi:hypothetical protein